MSSSTSSYRPRVRALVLGIAAVLIRVASLGAAAIVTASNDEHEFDLSDASLVLTIGNPVGTVLALAGVGYSAIAAHRREWNATLVIAWILNVFAALYVPELFVYAVF